VRRDQWLWMVALAAIFVALGLWLDRQVLPGQAWALWDPALNKGKGQYRIVAQGWTVLLYAWPLVVLGGLAGGGLAWGVLSRWRAADQARATARTAQLLAQEKENTRQKALRARESADQEWAGRIQRARQDVAEMAAQLALVRSEAEARVQAAEEARNTALRQRDQAKAAETAMFQRNQAATATVARYRRHLERQAAAHRASSPAPAPDPDEYSTLADGLESAVVTVQPKNRDAVPPSLGRRG
jgi:hypothetical protein